MDDVSENIEFPLYITHVSVLPKYLYNPLTSKICQWHMFGSLILKPNTTKYTVKLGCCFL